MRAGCVKCDFSGEHDSVLNHAEQTGHGVYRYGDGIYARTVNISLNPIDFEREMIKVVSKRLIEFYKDMEKGEEFGEKFPSIEGDDVDDAWSEINKKKRIDSKIINVLENLEKLSR